MKLVGAKIEVEKGFDNNIADDVFIVDPGRIIKNHLPETFFDKAKKFIEQKKCLMPAAVQTHSDLCIDRDANNQAEPTLEGGNLGRR